MHYLLDEYRKRRHAGAGRGLTLGWRCVSVVIALALAVPCTGFAQKVGTTSYQFLKVMPSARATGMGEAFASLADRSDALFWNPAGITSVMGHDLSSTHTIWLIDTHQTAIGYALAAGGYGHFGLQFQYVSYGEIEETRVDHLDFVGGEYNPGRTGRTFSPHAWVLGLTYSRNMTDRFSAGITGKYVNEVLFSERTVQSGDVGDGGGTYNTFANSLLFDFGMQYDTGFRSVRIGAAVQNFGGQVRFGRDDFPAPLTFRLGAASDLVGPNGLFASNDLSRFSVAYDVVHPNDYAQQMHMGAEYAFANVLTLRGGYKLNYDVDNWTFGGGVQTRLSRYRLSFDYSFGAMNRYLNEVHRLTLGLSIE